MNVVFQSASSSIWHEDLTHYLRDESDSLNYDNRLYFYFWGCKLKLSCQNQVHIFFPQRNRNTAACQQISKNFWFSFNFILSIIFSNFLIPYFDGDCLKKLNNIY